MLAFTVERLDGAGTGTATGLSGNSAEWKLQSTGRFAHSKGYLLKLANQKDFHRDVLCIEDMTPR